MHATIFSLFALFLGGCLSRSLGDNNKTRVKSIEDQSWFKNGVDRFYLAYAEKDELIGAGPEKQGQDILVGIGCYGEDKNRDLLVPLPADSEKTIKLSERKRIEDFLFAKDPAKPERGECVILLGNQFESAVIKKSLSPKLLEGAALKIAGASFGCWTLATSSMGIALAYTGATGAMATAVTAVAAAGTALGVTAVAAMTPVVWIALGAGAFGCVTGGLGGFEAIANYQKDENKKLFFKTLAEAQNLAQETMSRTLVQDSILENQATSSSSSSKENQWSRYKKLEKEGKAKGGGEKLMQAVALGNTYLVQAFNRDIHAKMEQGWFKETKFFDAIKSIAVDMERNASIVQ